MFWLSDCGPVLYNFFNEQGTYSRLSKVAVIRENGILESEIEN